MLSRGLFSRSRWSRDFETHGSLPTCEDAVKTPNGRRDDSPTHRYYADFGPKTLDPAVP